MTSPYAALGIKKEVSKGFAVQATQAATDSVQCGCYIPEFHAHDSLHKASFEFKRALSEEFDAKIRPLCELALDWLGQIIRRFSR